MYKHMYRCDMYSFRLYKLTVQKVLASTTLSSADQVHTYRLLVFIKYYMIKTITSNAARRHWLFTLYILWLTHSWFYCTLHCNQH